MIGIPKTFIYFRDEEILLVAANAWRMEEQNAIKTAIIATDIKVANYSSMVFTLPMIIYNVYLYGK